MCDEILPRWEPFSAVVPLARGNTWVRSHDFYGTGQQLQIGGGERALMVFSSKDNKDADHHGDNDSSRDHNTARKRDENTDHCPLSWRRKSGR